MSDIAGKGQNQIHEPYIDPQILADLTADTQSRLANPGAFLVTIIRRYWAESTAEEATSLWEKTVRNNPGYAIDVLNCLHQIIEDPPANLASLIVNQGRVMFYKTSPEGQEPYDAADYVAWLRDLYSDWYAILAAIQPDLSTE